MDKEKIKDYQFAELKDMYVDKYLLWRKVTFSDIMNFDPNNYTFFTYSISVRTTQSEFYAGLKKNGNAYSPSDDYLDIAFNPFDMKKKKRLSVALTTSVDNYTYGRIGYIVSAPVENILYVGQAPFDKTNEELRRTPLKTPQEAKSDMFREIVLEGSTMYGIVRPVAIFLNLSDATEEEVVKTMFLLEQIKKSTGGVFPVLDLSDRNYTLKSNFSKTL
ncbi:MAG: hypothetical protein E7161_05110 [Firmicutes bacterium]|nr:hypothetical protein [Bacillota bacterium]